MFDKKSGKFIGNIDFDNIALNSDWYYINEEARKHLKDSKTIDLIRFI